jgi:hypothetical protein
MTMSALVKTVNDKEEETTTPAYLRWEQLLCSQLILMLQFRSNVFGKMFRSGLKHHIRRNEGST